MGPASDIIVVIGDKMSVMEFRDVIARRRMVRNYLPDQIPIESLNRIVDAGLRAP